MIPLLVDNLLFVHKHGLKNSVYEVYQLRVSTIKKSYSSSWKRTCRYSSQFLTAKLRASYTFYLFYKIVQISDIWGNGNRTHGKKIWKNMKKNFCKVIFVYLLWYGNEVRRTTNLECRIWTTETKWSYPYTLRMLEGIESLRKRRIK